MNKTAIKNFAVWARTTLINAVTQMAFEYDVTENGKNDPEQKAVNGNSLTATEKSQRSQLIAHIKATPHISLSSEQNMKKHSAKSQVHIEIFNFMFTGRTESD